MEKLNPSSRPLNLELDSSNPKIQSIIKTIRSYRDFRLKWEKDQILEVQSFEDLLGLLDHYQINCNNWPKNKSPADLWQEIQKGECRLKIENNQLIRELAIITVEVYYQTPTAKYQLFENKGFHPQVFHRKKQKHLSEKRVKLETPVETMKRCLKEELQIEVNPDNKYLIKGHQIDGPSESSLYPGLKIKYLINRYQIFLTPEQYRKEGYSEQEGKQYSTFKWERI